LGREKFGEFGDPWWRLRGGVERFNTKRHALLRSVPVCVLDESMSAWRPRTSKEGGPPNISYVIRKPEPLGTEFKTAADAATDIMLALEIQEGKTVMDAMRARMGCTSTPSTSCVARLVSQIPIESANRTRGRGRGASAVCELSERSGRQYGVGWGPERRQYDAKHKARST
jgi:hypothetical protein